MCERSSIDAFWSYGRGRWCSFLVTTSRSFYFLTPFESPLPPPSVLHIRGRLKSESVCACIMMSFPLPPSRAQPQQLSTSASLAKFLCPTKAVVKTYETPHNYADNTDSYTKVRVSCDRSIDQDPFSLFRSGRCRRRFLFFSLLLSSRKKEPAFRVASEKHGEQKQMVLASGPTYRPFGEANTRDVDMCSAPCP